MTNLAKDYEERLLAAATDSQALSAILESIADLSKEESNRQTLHSSLLFSVIVNSYFHLPYAQNTSTTRQFFRAIGNLCYDNLENRKLFYECNATDCFIQELGVNADNIVLSALLNYAMDCAEICAVLYPQLCKLTQIINDNYLSIWMDILLTCLQNIEERRDVLDCEYCQIALNLIVAFDVDSEKSKTCIDIIEYLSSISSCEVLQLLSKDSVIASVIQNANSQPLLKIYCELVCDNPSIAQIFINSHLSKIIHLTESPNLHVDVVMNSLLLLGNLCNSDERCDLILPKLNLQNLTDNIEPSASIKIQHSTLSFFRNLSVSPSGAFALAKLPKFFEKLSSILKNNEANPAIVFLIVGIIRRLVLKKCLNLGMEDFLVLDEKFQESSDEGIKSEIARIFTTLAKTATAENIKKVIPYTQNITWLLQSKHEVLVNDAVLALIILISEECVDKAEKQVIASRISEKKDIFSNEVQSNLRILLDLAS